jgi:hypothetical protein
MMPGTLLFGIDRSPSKRQPPMLLPRQLGISGTDSKVFVNVSYVGG